MSLIVVSEVSQPVAVISVGNIGGPPPAGSVIGDGISFIVACTQAEYDALTPPNPATLYVITT